MDVPGGTCIWSGQRRSVRFIALIPRACTSARLLFFCVDVNYDRSIVVTDIVGIIQNGTTPVLYLATGQEDNVENTKDHEQWPKESRSEASSQFHRPLLPGGMQFRLDPSDRQASSFLPVPELRIQNMRLKYPKRFR